MFPRSSFGSAVSDIQSLLGDADPATADLDDATRAWLLHTRQAITAQQRGLAAAARRPRYPAGRVGPAGACSPWPARSPWPLAWRAGS